MIIKKYTGANVKEALSRVERELGKNAVIISQRAVRKPGIKGFFSPKIIEITATTDSVSEHDKVKELAESFLRQKEIIVGNNAAEKEEKPKDENSDIKKEVAEMKKLLNSYINKKDNHDDTEEAEIEQQSVIIEELKEKLYNLDFPASMVDEILSEVQQQKCTTMEETKGIIKTHLMKIIKTDESDVSGVVALVGPTGVGKTTTIAKLAGNLALVKKKKVGLVTVDTYRIGAVEQLKTYAEIMNINFKVVFSLPEMEEAINSMKDCDVILIDTTGRSSKNTMQVMELKAYIDKAGVNSSYLVVSATTKGRDTEIIADGFAPLGYDGVIITKLDETSSYGSIAELCNKTGVPVKYITCGQNVPEDIRVPSADELIHVVLGDRDLC